MDVGVQMVFASYGWSNTSDAEVWDEELKLARLAADLGFDVLWSVEHHFNDYSFCPDNLQLMSYLAAEALQTRDVVDGCRRARPWVDGRCLGLRGPVGRGRRSHRGVRLSPPA